MAKEKKETKAKKERPEGANLRKKDVIKEIATRTEFGQKEIKEVLNTYHAVIKETILSGQNFTLSGVGSLQIRQRQARQGFNPITKEKIQIPERKAVKFKPTREVKLELRK